MKADTLLTAVVALCCVLAIGATSTTLDSTVSTDPDDVAEVDYDKLPIGSGHAENLDHAIDGGKSSSSESGASPNSDSGPGADKSGTGSQSAASKDGEGGDSLGSAQGQGGPSDEASGEGQQDQQTAGDGKKTTQSSGGGSDSNSGGGKGLVADEPTLLERLMALLQQLFDLLLKALPYLILLALLGALYRYRDRILSRFAPTASDKEADEPVPEPDPDNPVSSAWFEMVERLDLDDRRDLTPREYAAAARRRGADADAVQTLTGLFEEVRYGGARVTEERRKRAEEIRDRVRSQLDRGDTPLETDGGTEDQRGTESQRGTEDQR